MKTRRDLDALMVKAREDVSKGFSRFYQDWNGADLELNTAMAFRAMPPEVRELLKNKIPDSFFKLEKLYGREAIKAKRKK